MKCSMCPNEIPAPRLAAIPLTLTCSSECSHARRLRQKRESKARIRARNAGLESAAAPGDAVKAASGGEDAWGMKRRALTQKVKGLLGRVVRSGESPPSG